jgi:hypothetical protein
MADVSRYVMKLSCLRAKYAMMKEIQTTANKDSLTKDLAANPRNVLKVN